MRALYRKLVWLLFVKCKMTFSCFSCCVVAHKALLQFLLISFPEDCEDVVFQSSGCARRCFRSRWEFAALTVVEVL